MTRTVTALRSILAAALLILVAGATLAWAEGPTLEQRVGRLEKQYGQMKKQVANHETRLRQLEVGQPRNVASIEEALAGDKAQWIHFRFTGDKIQSDDLVKIVRFVKAGWKATEIILVPCQEKDEALRQVANDDREAAVEKRFKDVTYGWATEQQTKKLIAQGLTGGS